MGRPVSNSKKILANKSELANLRLQLLARGLICYAKFYLSADAELVCVVEKVT
jgi:hypothetical protein